MYGTKEFHDRFVGIEGAFDKSLHALQKLNEKRKISVWQAVLLQMNA